MLKFSTHQHFATFPFNLERERRMLCVQEDEAQSPENGPHLENESLPTTASDISRGIHARITKGVLAGKSLEVILEQPSALIALFEQEENEDIRSQVEEKMREAAPEHYAQYSQEFPLPLHEVLWYLRDHADYAKEVRESGIQRLSSTPALVRFSQNLQAQVVTLQHLEEALSGHKPGLRFGPIDVARLRETESWLQEVCATHNIGSKQPNIADWLQGKYSDFAPTTEEAEKVLASLRGSHKEQPEHSELTGKASPILKAIQERIAARPDVYTAKHTLKLGQKVQQFSSSLVQVRKRKIKNMVSAKEKRYTEEDDYGRQSAQEQIMLMQSHIVEVRTIALQNIIKQAKQRTEEVKQEGAKRFATIDTNNAVAEYGTSAFALQKAFADTVQPLEQCIWQPPEPAEGAFETWLTDMQNHLDEHTANEALSAHIRHAQQAHQTTIRWTKGLHKNNALQVAQQQLTKQPLSPVVARMTTKQIEMLQETLSACERIATGNATGEDYNTVEWQRQDPAGIQNIEVLLQALSQASFQQQIAHAMQQQNTTTENNEQTREQLANQVDAIEAQLRSCPALQHEVCTVLQVEQQLLAQVDRARLPICVIKQASTTSLQEAAEILERLQKAVTLLKNIPNTIEHCTASKSFVAQGAATPMAAAAYNVDTNTILLNDQYIQTKELNEAEQVAHETGHAIVNILTRQTGVLAGLLVTVEQRLNQQMPSTEQTYFGLLEAAAKDWKVDLNYPVLLQRATQQTTTEEQAKILANSWYKNYMVDELLSQYGNWVRAGRKGAHKHITLFQHLEQPTADVAAASEETALGQKLQALALYNTEEKNADDETDTETKAEEGPNEETIKTLDVNNKLIEASSAIQSIRFFYESYSQYKSDLQPFYAEYLEAHSSIQKDFSEGKMSEQQAHDAIETVKEDVEAVVKIINQEKLILSDVSNAKATGTGANSLFGDIYFLSIMDIVQTVKQAGEDLKRNWDRRSVAKQATFGLSITDWIPKSVPYAGRLQDEFRRRDQEAEQKEVNEWKEKFNDYDSFELLDLLGKTSSVDQAKAIFILLSDRGRMDWNDERVWDALNNMSVYTMPKNACSKDDILRDKWLKKLTNDIWSDADLFTEWRQKNDNATESGKKGFTSVVDQISNINSGLSTELRNQLILWQKRKDGQPASPELNPHLYEEILSYSMRNGKMTMEDKLFYLVKGVAEGILSIDRLRTLAGEKGEILNQYPWIDYFYGRNNSMPEVRALSRRLTEVENGKDTLKPGVKTTLWLYFENMRTESTRQRISKALSGTRAENLDHEDIPTLVASADWVTIDRMTGNVSGTREKLSPEAIRNAYTGFSTKFKMLGQLAKLDKMNEAQFTDRDAAEAAKSIVAYLHYDNILTQTIGTGKMEDKPFISWDVLDNQTGPSTSDLTVGTYRSPQNAFVSEMVGKMNMDWTKYDGFDETNIIRHESIDGDKKESDRQNYKPDQMQKRSQNTKAVLQDLQAKIASNKPLLMELLMKYADELHEENYDKESRLSLENVRIYFAERKLLAV